jgi:hypothetical protein
MPTARRYRAVFDVRRDDITGLFTRAQTIYTCLDADKEAYPAPNPPLPAYLVLIQNLASSQQLALARGRGAAAARDAVRDLLYIGMESERTYVQGLADMSTSPVSVIQNAGLVVAGFSPYTKPFLVLTPGKQPGTVACDANVGLLVGTGAKHPHASRFFNWEVTSDGGRTFVSLPSTPTGKTIIQNLTPLTIAGVRVSLTGADGPGTWSPVAGIVVR